MVSSAIYAVDSKGIIGAARAVVDNRSTQPTPDLQT